MTTWYVDSARTAVNWSTAITAVTPNGIPGYKANIDIYVLTRSAAADETHERSGLFAKTGQFLEAGFVANARAAASATAVPAALALPATEPKAVVPGKLPAYATGSRPAASSLAAGQGIFDTTLHKPLWSTGTGYVDATGATVS